ncbi:MAG: hypothetical protein HYY45_15155 [Deltaproteobacteria bacterium]|nr:hypothetical protein [Deltaproteobacteria bacterium]
MTRSKAVLSSIFFMLILFWLAGLISIEDLKGSNLILFSLLGGILTGLESIETDVAEMRNMVDTMSNKDNL